MWVNSVNVHFKASQRKFVIRLNLWPPNDKNNSYFHFLMNKTEIPQQSLPPVTHQTLFLNLIPYEYHFGYLVLHAGSAILPASAWNSPLLIH